MSWAAVGDIVAALGGVGLGVWAGFRLGVRWGSPKWRYWLMNAGALVVCLPACMLGLVLGARWFAMVALGVLAGCLSGMKYGIRGGFVMHPGASVTAADADDEDAQEGADLANAGTCEGATEAGQPEGPNPPAAW